MSTQGAGILEMLQYEQGGYALPHDDDFSAVFGIHNWIHTTWSPQREMAATFVFVLTDMFPFQERKRKFLGWHRAITARSDAPIFQIMLPTPRAFGSDIVRPDVVVQHYLSHLETQRNKTLSDVSRSLRTWRKQNRIDYFVLLFEALNKLQTSESTMPLMLSALSESYLLRSDLTERKNFRQSLERRAKTTFGVDRANRIFGRLG